MRKALVAGALLVFWTVFRKQLAQARQAILPAKSMNTSGAKPVSQQDPAETAYQEEAVATLSEGAFGGGIFFKPVPAGKRLVVQYASVEIEVPPGQTARAALATWLNGESAFHQFPVFAQGVIAGAPTNRDAFTGGLAIPVYQDGGPPAPAIDVSRSAADGSAVALGTISGYLVDMP